MNEWSLLASILIFGSGALFDRLLLVRLLRVHNLKVTYIPVHKEDVEKFDGDQIEHYWVDEHEFHITNVSDRPLQLKSFKPHNTSKKPYVLIKLSEGDFIYGENLESYDGAVGPWSWLASEFWEIVKHGALIPPSATLIVRVQNVFDGANIAGTITFSRFFTTDSLLDRSAMWLGKILSKIRQPYVGDIIYELKTVPWVSDQPNEEITDATAIVENAV